ncbi:MAG: hypothetical protein JNL70_12060 [Saprospiraceae bacterium]|nr:hypothetical protein [Saprospiraceae bacterium]
MKNSVSKLIAFVLFAFVTSSNMFAQTFTEGAFDNLSATRLLVNTEATTIKTHFTKLGFADGGLATENTKRFTGTDKVGAFTIEIASLKMRKGTSIVQLTTISLKRGTGTDVIVMAEDGSNRYFVENGQVKTRARTSSSSSSVSDCVSQYFLGTASSCSSCVTCVTGCVSSNSDWAAKAICSVKCVGSCVSCVSNLIGFIKCVIKAL